MSKGITMKRNISTKLITATTAGLFAIFMNVATNAEIYKWTDSKGVVHYSSQKPPQKKVKPKNIENIELAIRSAAGKPKKQQTASSSRKSQGDSSEKKSNTKLSGPGAELISYCKKQRSNLKQLQENFRNVWQGIDGKKTKLNQNQRKSKVEYIQTTIAENCAGV